MRLQLARRTVGIALMGGSLLLGALTPMVATAAEGEGQVPEETETVEVERRAFWNADNSKYADNVATRQFPPEAVCLVQPDACFFPEGEQDPSGELQLGKQLNETTATVNSTEQELLTTIAENDTGPPADPVPPDNAPVSIAFGKPNYRAALQFPLPELPAGEEVDSFEVVLQEAQPTYATESPAFRQAVLAALTCASEGDAPVIEMCTVEEFQKIADREPLLDTPLTVEACPITGEWQAGTSQDEDTIPEVDCLFTAVGERVETADGAAWVFDLTFAAKAWYGGTLEQNGILLRPGAAENFAYGDPETTYSKQVTFAPEVQVATASSEPVTFSAPPTTGSTTSTNTAPPPSTGSTAPPPAPTSSGGVDVPATSTAPSTPTADQPAVSEPAAETAQPQPQPTGEQTQTLAAGAPLGQPSTPGWTWPSLVLMFLGGGWLLARSLQETAVAATERSGAMSRLLERRAAERQPDLVTG